MKPFFASIGQLWKEQKLAEKPARFVISTGTQDLLAKGKKSRPRWKKNGPSAVHKLGFRQIGYLVKENALLSNTVRSLDKDVSKTRKLHANAKQRE
ncbi:probable NAD(P)H dehydrogenase (quinone) FQR1-like 2 isoform X1 [Arachis hypogaea]|uniref:Uncharacterized protein n=1 Tax=Arachis hypogaea TaxID=3818 RepID=A0A445CYC0_ARAHY|nr:hypothetical protein Ahy_A05g021759 isoform G [Arachis hypogaea]